MHFWLHFLTLSFKTFWIGEQGFLCLFAYLIVLCILFFFIWIFPLEFLENFLQNSSKFLFRFSSKFLKILPWKSLKISLKNPWKILENSVSIFFKILENSLEKISKIPQKSIVKILKISVNQNLKIYQKKRVKNPRNFASRIFQFRLK